MQGLYDYMVKFHSGFLGFADDHTFQKIHSFTFTGRHTEIRDGWIMMKEDK